MATSLLALLQGLRISHPDADGQTRSRVGKPRTAILTALAKAGKGLNRLLTELTRSHDHTCECALCEARWRTDVQDAPACWTVPDVTPAEPGARLVGDANEAEAWIKAFREAKPPPPAE